MGNVQSYKALVEKVILDGRHGPYAVARTEALKDPVTFSLERNVWNESIHPDEGAYVMLSQVRKKRAGWRAERARFFEPADEQ